MTLYASATTGRRNLAALRRLGFGQLLSPVTEGLATPEWAPIALDNGAWTVHQSGGVFDFAAFGAFALRWAGRAEWIIAPDVVGDWAASRLLAAEWVPRLQAMGHRVLIAAQDGAEPAEVAAMGADGVAIGGSTAWKVAQLTRPAWRSCVYVHVLRVNTRCRLRRCWTIADSCDGTGATRFEVHAEKMRQWADEPFQLELL